MEMGRSGQKWAEVGGTRRAGKKKTAMATNGQGTTPKDMAKYVCANPHMYIVHTSIYALYIYVLLGVSKQTT